LQGHEHGYAVADSICGVPCHIGQKLPQLIPSIKLYFAWYRIEDQILRADMSAIDIGAFTNELKEYQITEVEFSSF
jgi:hypothetical protein